MVAALPLDTNRLVEICRKNDVAMIGVFGSAARGEIMKQSDIDLGQVFKEEKPSRPRKAGT